MKDMDIAVREEKIIFDMPHAEAINEARLSHLETLELFLENQTVLEVGSGIGKLTGFFEKKRCKVLSTESRLENIAEHIKRFPHRRVEFADLNTPGSHDKLGLFEVVVCYGTLYHLNNPLLALEDLSKICTKIFLLETCVHPTDNGQINPVSENCSEKDQAMHGIGCRPGRDWIFYHLKKLFPYVYATKTQPRHPDFPLEWPAVNSKGNKRAVFIASRTPIFSDQLINYLPKKQTRHTNFAFHHFLDTLKAIDKRLYYRDQSAASLDSLEKLAKDHDPTVIVELGTLAGSSLRAWLKATDTASIHAVDFNFDKLQETKKYFPFDDRRVVFHQKDIMGLDFASLWTENDRVLFFVDAHDAPGSPVMAHVLQNALPHLPEGSLVVVDDLWFSPRRLTADDVQEFFRDHLLPQIDELQCFSGCFGPYHGGGSFMGFSEVVPLLKFVNSRKVALSFEDGGKHAWFSWDRRRHRNSSESSGLSQADQWGALVYNPLECRVNEPLAGEILPKAADCFGQGKIQDAGNLLVDLVRKEPSQVAYYALAVCTARMGQLDQACKLANMALGQGTPHVRVNRLIHDLEQRVGRPKVQLTGRKGLTIFAMPKAFKGHEALIQKNAIRSWARLEPSPEIILMGDDNGVREMALEIGARHVPDIAANEFGTPLVDKIFHKAWQLGANDIMAYVNADIILLDDFLQAVEQVTGRFKDFLVVGQRWDLPVFKAINFDDSLWKKRLKTEIGQHGFLHAETGMDYFIHPRGIWRGIPPFALGRTAWDNWLIKQPLEDGWPVVDGTGFITAIHQDHGYGHCLEGRQGVWCGVEAQRNKAMAGFLGLNCITTAAAWAFDLDGRIISRPYRAPVFHTEAAKRKRLDWLLRQSKRLEEIGRKDLAEFYNEAAGALLSEFSVQQQRQNTLKAAV